MPEKEQRERSLSTLNKVGQFLNDFRLRNIVAQPRSGFDIDDIMANRKVFIANLAQSEANLAQGELGVGKSKLLVALYLDQLPESLRAAIIGTVGKHRCLPRRRARCRGPCARVPAEVRRLHITVAAYCSCADGRPDHPAYDAGAVGREPSFGGKADCE